MYSVRAFILHLFCDEVFSAYNIFAFGRIYLKFGRKLKKIGRFGRDFG